jgi:hypothetical protein
VVVLRVILNPKLTQHELYLQPKLGGSPRALIYNATAAAVITVASEIPFVPLQLSDRHNFASPRTHQRQRLRYRHQMSVRTGLYKAGTASKRLRIILHTT